jgi:hypothetical protein
MKEKHEKLRGENELLLSQSIGSFAPVNIQGFRGVFDGVKVLSFKSSESQLILSANRTKRLQKEIFSNMKFTSFISSQIERS